MHSVKETKSQKQPPGYPDPSQQSQAAFFDKLSKIYLTRRALKELNRRNLLAGNSHDLPLSIPSQHVALHHFGIWTKNHELPQHAADFIAKRIPGCYKDLRRLARLGGPDFSSLRGVRLDDIL